MLQYGSLPNSQYVGYPTILSYKNIESDDR
jgi:hypothetical protein